jgi:hypothetical protein
MRYLLSARVRPGRRADLLEALEDGRFGAGFPFGDLGSVLGSGRVDASGTIRWVEVCYCREYLGVAMEMELRYIEDYLTDVEVTDARSPRYCKGYPECNDCACTRKVRFDGEALLDYLRRTAHEPSDEAGSGRGRPTRWLGWRGSVSAEEARRNQAGASEKGGEDRPGVAMPGGEVVCS